MRKGAFQVTVTYWSRVPTSTWEADMDFDDAPPYDYTYTCPYPGGTPWVLGDKIQGRLQTGG